MRCKGKERRQVTEGMANDRLAGVLHRSPDCGEGLGFRF